MKSAIVIPAFNEATRIGATLDSLAWQYGGGEDDVIVVVDNASTDETQGVARAYEPRLRERFDLHVIEETEPGTGAACDTGFRYAIEELGAEVISRVDADTYRGTRVA